MKLLLEKNPVKSITEYVIGHDPITSTVAYDSMKQLHALGKKHGRVMIFGTGGDMKGGNNFKKLWDER
ncbi:MAG TPA: hypothetical protein ENK81_01840 [Euryarchaeota archaeon]|nr:hypothetical protein [Euryarchaeota archaeon]